jgi:hypothetical protein
MGGPITSSRKNSTSRSVIDARTGRPHTSHNPPLPGPPHVVFARRDDSIPLRIA